eukprot:4934326-Pleurochrysis_carterae.AAC.1
MEMGESSVGSESGRILLSMGFNRHPITPACPWWGVVVFDPSSVRIRDACRRLSRRSGDFARSDHCIYSNASRDSL